MPIRAAPSRVVGRCTVHTGRYGETGDGWLAFRRGRVTVLLTEHGTSRSALVRYAAQSLCR